MREHEQSPQIPAHGEHQPVFLLPNVITGLIGVMVAIQLAETLVLNDQGQQQLLLWFAFLPTRFVVAAIRTPPALAAPLRSWWGWA